MTTTTTETQAEIIERLKVIFESFLGDHLATTNNVYFDKLITQLAAKEHAFVLQAPCAVDWVDKCIALVSEDFGRVNAKVISFMLNFCALLLSNEWVLIQIKERTIMDKVLFIVERDVQRFNPSIKLGSIRLLSSVSQYSLGLSYMRSTRAWHFLIDYCNRDYTLYVVREARQLLYELLYKFSVKTKDEHVVLEILEEIFKPIRENLYEEENGRTMINVDDSELQHKLASTLDLISFILQKTLESEEKTNIALICHEKFKFDLIIWKLCEMTQNKFFLEKILTAMTSYNFAKLVQEQWTSGQIAPENFNTFGISFFNIMKFCMDRRELLNLLKTAELNHMLWKKLGQRAPQAIQIQNERIRFENQLITLQLMPVLSILRSKQLANVDIFDKYLMRLFEISCEHTLRICYAFRDVLLDATQLNADLAYKSIHGILALDTVLEREQAVLVFQAMIYSLKHFILSTNPDLSPTTSCDDSEVVAGAVRYELVVEHSHVLYAVLIGLQTLIQRYRITWKESIETICLANFVAVILKNPNLTSRLTVQALKVLQLSIEHFLSPNMALLVDNLQGSSLLCLGPIIKTRFHDTSWEVRDSTLELLTSIANISRLKFPSFQKFMVDFEMCPIVYEMAKSDGEPYVRASALKCLSQMIKINAIWESSLSKMNLIEHLLFVLYNESEGIVRKEAICTLSKLYTHRKIPNDLKDNLYSTLGYCAVDDLHWEVKVNALQFWELEIQQQFTDQGMIDNVFPTVTFSKENKKIVTLTEKEIKLRIAKIFDKLSQRGCLGVILRCLSDDCDLEVIKAAVSVVQRLFEKLKNYDYESIVNTIELATAGTREAVVSKPERKQPEVAACRNVDAAPTANSDAVIEDILSSQDINLLVAAYENQLHLNGGEAEKRTIDEHFYQRFSHVTGKEFISKVKSMDVDQLLHSHDEWLQCSESFVSLLDDIMFSIKPNDSMNMADCY